jgi:hypothetical protein
MPMWIRYLRVPVPMCKIATLKLAKVGDTINPDYGL